MKRSIRIRRPLVALVSVMILAGATSARTSAAAGSPADMTPEEGPCAPTEGLSSADGIFVVNVDGAAMTRLTECNDEYPTWSHDGGSIAFASASSQRGKENYEIYVISVAAPQARRLTDLGEADSRAPDWSPDGRRIAFQTNRDGNDEIYLINADGTGLVPLTTHDAADTEPNWSPDGTRVAFTSNRDGNEEIYIAKVDGGEVQRVTTHDAADDEASWSPDGRRIAFFSRRDGNHEIYVVNSDGTGLARLTNDPAPDFDPDWSPDAGRIVFERLHAADHTSGDLFVMDADGSGVTNVTNNPQDNGYANPAWSPTGSKIAFNVH